MISKIFISLSPFMSHLPFRSLKDMKGSERARDWVCRKLLHYLIQDSNTFREINQMLTWNRGRSNSNTRIRLWLLFPHNQILYLYLFPFKILELL